MRPPTAWLIAGRLLVGRPVRTAVLLLGYGVGVAVMVALLAVGEGLLAQAQDKDLSSGGDVVLLPQGVDLQVLKVGGVTGMFLSIPNARYVAGQMLLGPRYADIIDAVSPELLDKLVYIRAPGSPAVVSARASGVIPSLARQTGSVLAVQDPAWADSGPDRQWTHPSLAALLPAIDRFHAAVGGPEARSWAEWWYFNIASTDGSYGYLSFVVGASREVTISVAVSDGRGRTVRWQDRRTALMLPVDGTALVAGPHSVRLVGGQYRIRLDGAGAVADLTVTPTGGAYFPPAEWQSGRFRSGYVVPVLRADVTGMIRIGDRVRPVIGTGYHDHNWGVWDRVTWEWGAASTPGVALLAGLIRHPALRDPQMFVSLYVLRGERPGLLSVLRADPPRRDGWRVERDADGRPVRIPGRLGYRARNDAGDTVDVEFVVRSVLATPADGEVFLQLRGLYRVTGTVRGRSIRFETDGFAETFVAP